MDKEIVKFKNKRSSIVWLVSDESLIARLRKDNGHEELKKVTRQRGDNGGDKEK